MTAPHLFSTMETDSSASGLNNIHASTDKMDHQPSCLPSKPVTDMSNETDVHDLDMQSHISHMSMDTSVAPHQSERSEGTSSKTPDFSSRSSPESAERNIKQEPDLAGIEGFDIEPRYFDGSEIFQDIDGFPSYREENIMDEAPPLDDAIRADDGPSPAKRRRVLNKAAQLQFTRMRARVSNAAAGLPREELARQGIDAALASRLNPYTLHHEEYHLLREHITRAHVTAYLNVRNRILRLWVRNPLVSVTPEEAAGCASEERWLSLAQVAYDWLVRKGYINFGCVEVPDFTVMTKRLPKITRRRQKIVVIGAGMAGLGCARQLEGLFNHYRQQFRVRGEEPPEVEVWEGRARLGGRIYSIPLKNQSTSGVPENIRATAEMGAHIITGFDNGNPMNTLVRGQLAIPYYPLKDNSKLYDIDGKIVDAKRDRMAERLFNDMLERLSTYRHKIPKPKTFSGERDLIEAGKDPADGSDLTIAEEEDAKQAAGSGPSPPRQQPNQVPVGVDKLTGKMLMATGEPTNEPPVSKAEAIGFEAATDQTRPSQLNLDHVAKACQFPTLGQVMDEGVRQYQALLNLTPQDLRLLNWHFANLEYANAVNVGKLSLGGWDIDIGYEFEGEHAQVIGGYIQVPRGLWQVPNELELKTRKHVSQIAYDPEESGIPASVVCEDGTRVEADMVVCTVPLGVLKDGSIKFDPPLPDWKQQSIERLGFGSLNKLVLVFEEAFWDVDRDMIGLLRDTPQAQSTDQADYTTNRGRFYLFWNCIKTTGRPVLIALMAGDAAHQAEASTDGELVLEVLQQLQKMFKRERLPVPTETVVTRWGKDKFARGTYSYVAPEAKFEDYDNMAKKVGNLYFAGEATCGTHPATAHGAYLSGLRAAADILEDLLGPIHVPQPLVSTTIKIDDAPLLDDEVLPAASMPTPPAAEPVSDANGESAEQKFSRLQNFENDIINAIVAKLGPRPEKPDKAGANPFLLFSRDYWAECKASCDTQRRAIVGDPTVKASRNEVRAALGKMWREASDEVKRPYIELTNENRVANKDARSVFEERIEQWDADAIGIRREYINEHPDILSAEEEAEMWDALGVVASQGRKAKMASGLADEQR